MIDVKAFTPFVAAPRPPTLPEVVPSVVLTPEPLMLRELPIRSAAVAAAETSSFTDELIE